MAEFPGSQTLQRAELKLFHCAFGAREFMRDFANALVLGEAHKDDATLIGRKPIDKPEEPRALFDFNFYVVRADIASKVEGRRNVSIPRCAFGPIDDRICGDPEEPRGERHTAPFKARKSSQRLVEYFGGQVLGFMAIANAPRDVCINSFKVILVKLGEPGRILLSGLDCKPLR
jgi:hypothetical protein